VDAQHARVLQRTLRAGTRALYASGEFYDHFYRRRSRDVEFYVWAAQRFGGPVLELGVGTGRVARALAKAGFDVVGIDAMPSMLQRARSRLAQLKVAERERIELRAGDMRRFAIARRFPLLIAPFNAFTHLYTRRDLERTLERCRAHLKPGGRLAFDVVMPDLTALLQDPERLYRGRDLTDPGDRQRYAYYEASHYDAERQIRSVTLVMEPRGAGSARAIPLTQRQFFPAELEALLHYNGFELEERYGDFGRGPLTDASETQAIVASVRVRGHSRPMRRRAPPR
jgi:SAM-dependent methyltransferase